MITILRASAVVVLVVPLACTKREAPTQEPSSPPPATGTERPEPARASITAAECEAQGGRVVGDIGDGAIHRPDYPCPDTGEPPMGSITPEQGGAIPVEGAVCCRAGS